MCTPFKARPGGDSKAESHTHVDGVAGHFSIAAGTKLGIELVADCRYVAVFEGLRDASSQGSYMGAYIIDMYPWEKSRGRSRRG